MRHKQGAIKAIRFYFIRFTNATIIVGIFITAGCSDPQAPGFAESLKENQSPLRVIQTTPEDDAQNIELKTYIQAIFNTHLDPESIHESTLIIHEDTVLVKGSLVHNDSAITFFPAEELKRNTRITASISPDIADTLDNNINQEYEWSFTTRPPNEYEKTPPSVAETTPVKLAEDISLDANISARFSKTLNPETINSNTFYLKNTSNIIVPGSVNYTDSTATFNPSGFLNHNTTYTATITNDIEDLFGNSPNQNYNWTFTTKVIDRSPPHVISTNPRDNERNVDDDITITATFNEPMDPATIGKETFLLYQRHRGRFQQISGSVDYANQTARFTPYRDLRDEEDYIAVISSSVTDLAGNKLGETYRWGFETEDD